MLTGDNIHVSKQFVIEEPASTVFSHKEALTPTPRPVIDRSKSQLIEFYDKINQTTKSNIRFR
jgi:hypothetical protein